MNPYPLIRATQDAATVWNVANFDTALGENLERAFAHAWNIIIGPVRITYRSGVDLRTFELVGLVTYTRSPSAVTPAEPQAGIDVHTSEGDYTLPFENVVAVERVGSDVPSHGHRLVWPGLG